MALKGTPSNLLEQFVDLARSVPREPPEAKPAGQTPNRRKHKLTAAERVDVMRGYQAGSSLGSLAKEFSVSKDTISRIVRQAGLPRHHRGPTDEQMEEAIRLYAQGWSTGRIAERFGFNQGTIWRHLKKRGVVMRSPNDWQTGR